MGLESNILEEYDERFTEHEKNKLNYFGIKPSIANQYPERFDAEEIIVLFEAGINPKQANAVSRVQDYCSNY